MTKKQNNQAKSNKSNGSIPLQSRAKQTRARQPPRTKVQSAPAAVFGEVVPYFEVKRGRTADGTRVVGQDFLSQFTISTSTAVGQAALNFLLCPGAGALVNSRLGKYAQLYDKYIFHRLKFYVQSSASTNHSGSYLLTYDRDASDPTPAANTDALRSYFGHAGSRSGAAWNSIAIDCPLTDTQDFFYTSPEGSSDERLVYQGQIYVVCNTPYGQTTNYSLWVEYDCEFMDPQLQLSLVEAKQAGFSGPTSSAPRAAWNQLTTGQSVTNAVPFIQDVNGNRGFVLSPGTWYLEQTLQQSSAGGNVIAASYAIDAVTGLDISSTVVTALDTAFSVLPAVAAGIAMRTEKFTVPGPNNAIAFGNWGTGSQTISNAFVRVLEILGSSLV